MKPSAQQEGATVTLGPADGSRAPHVKSKAGIGIIRQAQSNTLNISRAVHVAVAEIQKGLTDGTVITIIGDDAIAVLENIVRLHAKAGDGVLPP